jgi:hypothetical protein
VYLHTHSDAQVSMKSEWGFRGLLRVPSIKLGECRAVVWHTCARRLRIRRKCNRRGEILGSLDGDRYGSFERVFVASSTPSRGGGCVVSILPNVVFGLEFVLDLSGLIGPK